MRIPRGLSLLLLGPDRGELFHGGPFPRPAPQTPKVERVEPLDTDPSLTAPGVFFAENLERITDLKQSFQDLATSDGRFGLSTADAFSGKTSIQQTYIPLTEYGKDDDPGGAGWCMRFFGDNPHLRNAQEHKPHRTVVARWYHKFEEGFTSAMGTSPNKMARLRCFKEGDSGASPTSSTSGSTARTGTSPSSGRRRRRGRIASGCPTTTRTSPSTSPRTSGGGCTTNSAWRWARGGVRTASRPGPTAG